MGRSNPEDTSDIRNIAVFLSGNGPLVTGPPVCPEKFDFCAGCPWILKRLLEG
jgi:hypothetical protein